MRLQARLLAALAESTRSQARLLAARAEATRSQARLLAAWAALARLQARSSVSRQGQGKHHSFDHAFLASRAAYAIRAS